MNFNIFGGFSGCRLFLSTQRNESKPQVILVVICIDKNKKAMKPLVLVRESKSMKNMRTRKPKMVAPKTNGADVIKLQVDYKTVIMVKSQKALEMWMGKYPNAKVVA